MKRREGNITKRGRSTYRIKWSIKHPETGERIQRTETVRGTAADARDTLRRRITEAKDGTAVLPSTETVGSYAAHWLAHIAPSKAGAKTLERYRELVENFIVPALGQKRLQKLRAHDIESFYAYLRTNGRRGASGGLSQQTCLHVHARLSALLKSAVRKGLISSNPMDAVETKPTAPDREVQVLQAAELTALLKHLEGKHLYAPVFLAAGTGMRRSEILGLRWRDVNFDARTVAIEQVVEQTNEGLSFKAPKTRKSRRVISVDDSVIDMLRAHRANQAASRLRLGLGRTGDGLVFPSVTDPNAPMNPKVISNAFAREAKKIGLPQATLHILRHTFISHLLANGIDIKTVQHIAGHARATTTLDTYASKLVGTEDKAVKVSGDLLRGSLS